MYSCIVSFIHILSNRISPVEGSSRRGGGQINQGMEMEPVSGEDETSSSQYHPVSSQVPPQTQTSYRLRQYPLPSQSQSQSSSSYLYDYPRQPSVQVVSPLSSNEEGRLGHHHDSLRPMSSSSLSHPNYPPPPLPRQDDGGGEDEENDSDAYGSTVAGVLV